MSSIIISLHSILVCGIGIAIVIHCQLIITSTAFIIITTNNIQSFSSRPNNNNNKSIIMAPPRFEEAVTAMTLPENRFDVTIICTTDDYQANFWMTKLKKKNTTSTSSTTQTDSMFPLTVAISEDWTNPSGAGNGLGTLYAWKKACAYVSKQQQYQHIDLDDLLHTGIISAALYHTAGKGTRLAPLPASENNNKPGVVSFFVSIVCLFVSNMHFRFCSIRVVSNYFLIVVIIFLFPYIIVSVVCVCVSFFWCRFDTKKRNYHFRTI